MRQTFDEIVEKGRLLNAGRYSTKPGARYGAFLLRCRLTGEALKVIASNGETLAEVEGCEPWDHVSVSCERRCPTWVEMCWIKELFFEDSECVVEYHPPRADYVNENPFVLHLWRSCQVPFPMPPKFCV